MVQAASTEQVGSRYITIAFSYATLFFAGGQLIGPAISGWLIELTGDFRSAIAFTCVGLAIGLLLTYRMRSFPPEPAIIDREQQLHAQRP
ncbi:hypothetical protein CAI21_18430 [Alkalilimnicola ehrlichii]|uniref:Major facilitator superfamily (MFS) profile domain-containing protein n=1 Tax=Alkalilimnicola ehrlichii TaxID=351052 RepID=A0A3E0WJ61_9GAMM|nr:YbfB/YjiJ family MFS transporter [Alkalilimnicola ehrlichii]RFA25746.1 hypothetical protein CAI21_18430 [Alkalilimnicola ehrlichii]RFA32828.1 hypothetical protein CAL65_18680 [Alkalilimnicola ehrlichii]